MSVRKILILGYILAVFCACSDGNGTQEEVKKADSLVDEVIKGNLKLKDLAESNNFMYFNKKFYTSPANLDSLPLKDRIQVQVVSYRIFKNVKLIDNRYVFKVQSAKQLHIPNQAFVYYQRSFDQMTRRAVKSRESLQLKLFGNADSLLNL